MYPCFVPFYSCIIYHCINIQHFVHHSSVIGHWVISTFCLFQIITLWSFVDKYLFKHIFLILWYIPANRIEKSYGNSVFYFLRCCLTFSKAAAHLTFLLAMCECSDFLTTRQNLVLTPSKYEDHYILYFIISFYLNFLFTIF